MKAALVPPAYLLLLCACTSAAVPEATAAPLATSATTPIPTFSPPPIPTLQLPSPTASVTPAPVLSCALNWQFPLNGSKVEPRADFTARWNVTNTGNVAWEPGAVDLEFIGGTPMHFSPVLPLQEEVAPGQSITLSVDMKTHRDTRRYTTFWALSDGKTHFCTLSILIHVQWVIDNEQF